MAALCLATVLAPAAEPAVAWGEAGHWTIGEIAAHFLSPAAELEVERLLEPGPYDTLATAGYWADAHARLYRSYDDYLDRHFIDVDPAADTIDLARDCPGDCVLRAIDDLSRRLGDRGRPRWRRAQDFRFLVHFVEDVHQPLHVTHPDDRGGNLTSVVLLGEEMNLHSAWDYGFIELRLAALDDARGPMGSDVPAWREWAYELRLAIDREQREAWAAETDPVRWAEEGIEPARRLTFDVEDGAELGREDYDAALPVIERRVQMAAVRLATLLNRLFDEER